MAILLILTRPRYFGPSGLNFDKIFGKIFGKILVKNFIFEIFLVKKFSFLAKNEIFWFRKFSKIFEILFSGNFRN